MYFLLASSCGSCGYPLNLTSSNRITSGIGSDYRQSIKKGYISFVSIDLSRFTCVDEINCFPIFWGRRVLTKLEWSMVLEMVLPPLCSFLITAYILFFDGLLKSSPAAAVLVPIQVHRAA
ncbi:hypothetical protein U1Q18_020599 [Sarracenia purpurea var. burkii]